MNASLYTISDEVFSRFPGYVRGVVIAYEVRNGPSPPELVQLLRDAEESVRAQVDKDGVAEEPRIKAWRDAFRQFGVKPSEFRSSVESMVRRVLRGDKLPSISVLVDIGNIVSLRHLVPAGGHAIDKLAGDIELRFATGQEQFVAFGSDVTGHPERGEVVFVEGQTVLTRRWTWRQANHTLMLPETRAVEFNVDGLPPVTQEQILLSCAQITDLTRHFCGGVTRTEIMTAINPRISLAP